jgi:hypothetical protein
MKFSRFTQMLVLILTLGAGLHAGNAAARAHAPAGQPRYAAWSGWHERYPLGSPDFYHQFAEERGNPPATLTFTNVAGGVADPLRGTGVPSTYGGGTWTGASLDAGQELRSLARGSGERGESTGSGLALPIAALGLMLYVARRRASLQ